MPCAELKPETVPPTRELPRAGSCFSPTGTALGIGAVMRIYHSSVVQVILYIVLHDNHPLIHDERLSKLAL